MRGFSLRIKESYLAITTRVEQQESRNITKLTSTQARNNHLFP